jgi:hypothetical protein
MTGKLVRLVAMFPIPPRYAGEATATVVLTAMMVALLQVHSFHGVVASGVAAVALVVAVASLHRSGSRTA